MSDIQVSGICVSGICMSGIIQVSSFWVNGIQVSGIIQVTPGSLWAVPRSESEEKGVPHGSQPAGERPPTTARLPSPVLDICERMSGSPQASYPQTHSFTLKHQDIRTFWKLNMQGIGGEGTEEQSRP
ncbi:hypothetical protein H8959_001582 [Pygathrix nigripes]